MAGITGTKQHTWILFSSFHFLNFIVFSKAYFVEEPALTEKRKGSGVRTVPGVFLSESQVAEILLYRPGKNRAGVS